MTRKFSAGGIVFKKVGKKTLWLLRRPAPNPGFDGNLGWNLPRGLVDDGESTEIAAVREVEEEAGVKAKIVAKLPTIKIFFTDKESRDKIMKFITFYLMEWVADSPAGFGWETAEVKWVNFKEASEMLAFKNEKEILKKAAEIVPE